MKARVEDPRALVNQFIRDRQGACYQVTAVGDFGVTCYQVDPEGTKFGPETCVTWAAVKHCYTILVPLEDIDDRAIKG